MGRFDAAGFHPDTADTWQQRLSSRYVEGVEDAGGTLDLTVKTPQGQTIGIVSASNAELDQFGVWLTQALNPRAAEGYQQDDLGTLLGIDRVPATHSTVQLELTGASGTEVEAGTVIEDELGNEWRIGFPATEQNQNGTDYKLTAGTVLATAEAVEDGPVEAAAGTIINTNTSVRGWETVTNPAPATPGEIEQSDDSYRRAYPILTARNARGTVDAIRAGLVEAGAELDVAVIENDTASLIVKQKFPIPQGSIIVVAEGGENAALSKIILANKGMGVPPMTSQRGAQTKDLTLSELYGALTITFNGEDITYSADTGTDPDAYSWEAAAARLTNGARTHNLYFHISVPGSDRIVAVYPHIEGGEGLATTGDASKIGFAATARTESPGAFVRPQAVPLKVEVEVTVYPGFPLDGTTQIRNLIVERVQAYKIGDTLFNHDLLAAIQIVAGADITSISVEDSAGDEWSSVEPPLDTQWELSTGNITVNTTVAGQ